MKELWPRSVRILLFVLLLFAGLLLISEVFDDHSTEIFGFYAWAGFLSCVVLIVIALLIGKIIKRRDNYYDN